MRINNPLGGGIFGRLVLPNGYVRGQRYPLIFTTYRAGTQFLEGAVGNEFPIFPFAAHGFVVFAMDTGTSNIVSDSGDREFSSMRVRKPLEAMMMLRDQLANEGIVDPQRCGITGLSYGGDIAAHAVATMNVFKAASLPVSWQDPITHTLGSVTFTKELEKRGFTYPYDDGALEEWRNQSVALNAARVTTPLLIQAPESEAMVSIETFKALKRHKVPVEWYVYLGEGHVKVQPRSKYLAYQRNLDWFRFWLKEEEDSDPAKAEQYARWRKLRQQRDANVKSRKTDGGNTEPRTRIAPRRLDKQ
jgi:dipeptidyl aminopeptidase/acylaminoacyl peptidase